MKDKRNRHGAVGKSSLEQHLAQLGLTAGRLADEIQVNLKNFK